MYRLAHDNKNYGFTPNLDFNPLPTRFNLLIYTLNRHKIYFIFKPDFNTQCRQFHPWCIAKLQCTPTYCINAHHSYTPTGNASLFLLVVYSLDVLHGL